MWSRCSRQRPILPLHWCSPSQNQRENGICLHPLPLWKKHSKNSQQAKTPRKGQKRFFSALPPASLFPKCLQRFGLDVGHVIWIALKVITGIHQDLIKDFVEAGNEVDLRIPFDAARGWNAISGWQSSSSPSRVPSKVLASLWTIFCLASSQTHSLQHSNNKSIQASRSDLFNDMFNDMFNEDCSASLSASQWTRHRCLGPWCFQQAIACSQMYVSKPSANDISIVWSQQPVGLQILSKHCKRHSTALLRITYMLSKILII